MDAIVVWFNVWAGTLTLDDFFMAYKVLITGIVVAAMCGAWWAWDILNGSPTTSAELSAPSEIHEIHGAGEHGVMGASIFSSHGFLQIIPEWHSVIWFVVGLGVVVVLFLGWLANRMYGSGEKAGYLSQAPYDAESLSPESSLEEELCKQILASVDSKPEQELCPSNMVN